MVKCDCNPRRPAARALALALAFAFALSTPTLGQEAGTRNAADSEEKSSGTGNDANASRRTQMNKRLGLSARRNGGFDPKVFEARGRELHGRFYEIETPVSRQNALPDASIPIQEGEGDLHRKGRRNWMIWAGVAGVAGASAAAAGYFLMYNAHPSAPPPKVINLTDGP